MVEQSTTQQQLKAAFDTYATDSTMEGKQFVKIFKDLNLLDKKRLTTTDIDLIFAKIKEKAARRISFTEFLSGIDLVAQKKGLAAQELR